MRKLIFLILSILLSYAAFSQPVFKNPGLPDKESFILHENLDPKIGYVTSKIDIELMERNGSKYYSIQVNEGGYFLNKVELNYSDLTTISEKRYNLKTNTLEQYYIRRNDTIHFYDKSKGVNKIIPSNETNIYSSLAYFVSFRGFPFKIGNSVSFKTYMYMYGDVLTMKLKNVAIEKVTVKAGTFDCYVLELSVGGWQSLFANDKYYLYFTVAQPHIFVEYKEKIDGIWMPDEIVSHSP